MRQADEARRLYEKDLIGELNYLVLVDFPSSAIQSDLFLSIWQHRPVRKVCNQVPGIYANFRLSRSNALEAPHAQRKANYFADTHFLLGDLARFEC